VASIDIAGSTTQNGLL